MRNKSINFFGGLSVEEKEKIFSFFSNPENLTIERRYFLAKELGISFQQLRAFMMRNHISLTNRFCPNCQQIFNAKSAQKICYDCSYPIRRCLYCGEEFRPKKNNANQIFCNRECRDIYWKRWNRHSPISKKILDVRVRQLKYGQVSSEVRRKIFEITEYFSFKELYALRDKIDYLVSKC